jgi:asparagine synthase (glutamine-hydrolysing)
MCGIAGAINPAGGIDPSALLRMSDRIEHRGPDGEGYLIASPADARLGRSAREQIADATSTEAAVGFAHRRLTIIDLSERNDQPMVDGSGDYAIAYNGEVYNYLELREELSRLGHSFRSEGDTEVVLEAYKEWGAECVKRFVGMWAFAILDRPGRTVLLSRDRFGIKPLYHARIGDALYFASEIKALLALPGLEVEPDEEVARRFQLSGIVDFSERTFFRGITQLPPAHNLRIPVDKPEALRPARYWSYPPQNGRAVTSSDAAQHLRELLDDSVRIHARSDVPVGTCLSGGLDSSSIVCLAEELRAAGEIPEYTHSAFGYLPEDEAFSERRYMESVAESTQARMVFVETDLDRFVEKLLAIVRQQDEPFGSTSIAAQWFVFERARQEGMKVMLDGQGADEVLGGYPGYFPVIASNLLRTGHFMRYARFHREHKALLGRGPLPLRGAVWSALPGPARRAVARGAVLPLPPAAGLMSSPSRERARAEYRPNPPGTLQELLQSHTESLGLPSLLRFEDRNSMAHSIEARVPLLDHRLVEFAFTLPDELKINGLETKYVLREAMRGVVPEAVRARKDKVGFRAEPKATWALVERHRDSLLENRTPYEERWFDSNALAAAFDGSDRSHETEFMVWRALNLKLWLRIHWGDSADPLS